MQTEKLMSLIAACALVAGGVAIVAPAVAKERPVIVTAPRSEVPTRYVSYRDLDLKTDTGEQLLVRRVKLAVRSVCAESLGPSPVFYLGTACRRDSWSRAQPQIDRAVQRSREIAAMGWSSIAPVTISITAY